MSKPKPATTPEEVLGGPQKEEKRRLALYFPAALAEKIQVEAVLAKISASELATELIELGFEAKKPT